MNIHEERMRRLVQAISYPLSMNTWVSVEFGAFLDFMPPKGKTRIEWVWEHIYRSWEVSYWHNESDGRVYFKRLPRSMADFDPVI